MPSRSLAIGLPRADSPRLEFTQNTQHVLLRSLLRIDSDDRVRLIAFGCRPCSE